ALDHRDLMARNKELERENMEYHLSLEKKVLERTRELDSKTAEVKKAYSILKSMNLQFVNVLAETIEAKDRHTRGHCNRMRFICVEIGRLLGLSENDIEVLEYASILHDLGKIGVNDFILNKNGPLDKDELNRIKEHPEIGEKILQGIPMMDTVAKIIGAHHENFDGTGYPKGLKGGDIPLASRVIAVADIYDAMTSDRPYRKGLPLNVVLDEMNRVSGTQLDPAIAGLFIGHRLYRFNGACEEGPSAKL
ncbi:MAG: HD-GYP domain-containing protein, partial [Deltaproteobacteria bacterium]